MIQLKNISFAYSNKALFDHLNLEIASNKLTCLLGGSGCGKTTLLRLISGLETPANGQIIIDSKVLCEDGHNIIPVNKREIGFVFQDLALWPHLTVYENVSFGLKEQKSAQIDEKTTEILQFFGIFELLEKFPHQLSGGQKQLVAMARSMVLQPKILLMDEPLANLDVKLKRTLLAHINKLKSEFDITIIYVTHDHREAFNIADNVVVMDEGKIIENGSVAEIKTSKNDFVKWFLEY